MSASEDVNDLWMEALEQYENMAPKRTYKDKVPFFTIKTPKDLDDYLNKTERSFKLFREKRAKLSRRLKACMEPFTGDGRRRCQCCSSGALHDPRISYKEPRTMVEEWPFINGFGLHTVPLTRRVQEL
jgi:hypothetical protein